MISALLQPDLAARAAPALFIIEARSSSPALSSSFECLDVYYRIITARSGLGQAGLETPGHGDLHIRFAILDQFAGQIQRDALDGAGEGERSRPLKAPSALCGP